MFWRKKSVDIEKSSELIELVGKLGIEKRQFVRVRYPRLASVCQLPEVSYQNHRIDVNDISLGGCCLLDPAQFLGASVGGEIELTFHWITGDEVTRARLVSRVDHRRHLQFINLSERRQNSLRKSMAAGERALTMRRGMEPGADGAELVAREIWSSALGDTLVLESGVHHLGTLRMENQEFFFYREARPVDREKQPVNREQFEKIILFLSNLANPSPFLSALIVDLQTLFVSQNTQGESV